MEIGHADLGVAGEVQHDGAGTAGAGDVEGPGDGPGDLVGAADLPVPFADRGGEADDVGFLEGVRAEGGGGDLSRDDHDGRRIRHRVGDAGDDVRGAGAGSDDDHTGRALDPRIALGRVDGTLFVPDEDVADTVPEVAEAVIHGHDLSAGIPEDGIHPFRDEGAPQGF